MKIRLSCSLVMIFIVACIVCKAVRRIVIKPKLNSFISVLLQFCGSLNGVGTKSENDGKGIGMGERQGGEGKAGAPSTGANSGFATDCCCGINFNNPV